MRRYIFLFSFIFAAIGVFAENVSNVRVRQEGKTIVVTYDLSKTTNVRLLMATNMSNDFKELKHVTGNVGENVLTGTNRTIKWNVLEEFGRFVADGVRFKVESYMGGYGVENGHEWVDLGLSVKWATCNVGASNPKDSGCYFAWGETKPKQYYYYNTYIWCRGTWDTLIKYNTRSEYGIVDNKTILELSNDAAHVNWGGSWRMATRAELDELRKKCTWNTIKYQDGKYAFKVTSKSNGNSIILPVTGYRSDKNSGYKLPDSSNYYCYWLSSLDTKYPKNAYAFWGWILEGIHPCRGIERYLGLMVRPVCP